MTQLIRGWIKHLTPPVPGWQRTDPLDRGLIGHWRFDPTSGLLLPDYGGRGNHGTVNGATWVNTEHGPALNFDGNDYVTCGTPAYDPAVFSVAAFMRVIGAGAVQTLMHWKANGASTPTLVSPRWAGSSIIYLGVTNYQYFNHVPVDVDDGDWHHVVFVVTGGAAGDTANALMYADGRLQTKGASDFTGALSAKNEIFIGRVSWASAGFEGDIADLRWYNRVLTQDEAAALHEQNLKRAQAMTHVWMMPWGRAPVAPPVGGHMTLWGRYWGP